MKGTVKGAEFVGGIVGANYGTVTNCYFNDVDENNLSTVNGVNYVGGITGYSAPECIISYCYSDADVSGSCSSVGGIVGWANSIPEQRSRTESEMATVTVVSGTGRIEDCYFDGTVTKTGVAPASSISSGYSFRNNDNPSFTVNNNSIIITAFDNAYGGIIGWSNGYQVLNCENRGNVSGSDFVGGIVGDSTNGTKIDNCTNSGNVSGESWFTGGVTGMIYAGKVLNCTNTSIVSGKSFVGGIIGAAGKLSTISENKNDVTADVSGTEYVGGITGLSNTVIENSSNAGKIKAVRCVGGIAGHSISRIEDCVGEETAVVENIDGDENNYVGGIVGIITDTVSGCTNKGIVEGLGKYTGGVAGDITGDLQNCVNYDSSVITGNEKAGGIAGECEGTIKKCQNMGSISGSTDIGGVTGRITGRIEGCENTGTVNGNGMHVGGIAGLAKKSSIESCNNSGAVYVDGNVGGICGNCSNSGSIKNCRNTGYVSVITSYAGGIAGISFWDIEGCVNSGTVGDFDKLFEAKNIGGIAGGSEGAIYNCQNERNAKVYGVESTGGIVGYNALGGSIDDCVNEGCISGKYSGKEGGSGLYTGGIAGKNGGSISQCTNTASVSSSAISGGVVGYNANYVEDCINVGYIYGYDNAIGGIAGCNTRSDDTTGLITGCTNKGKVGGEKNIGGIVGYVESADIFKCINYGEVSGKGDRVGGVTACVIIKSGLGDDAKPKIEYCDNYGKITGENAEIGGIAAYSDGIITSCNNYSDITGDKKRAGGISAAINTKGVIDNCINYGKITVADSESAGICGTARGEVKNCINKGEVAGGSYDTLGGIVGGIDGRITSCVNMAPISGDSYIGGIVGFISKAQLTDCRNTAEGKISGSEIIGGIVGGTKAVDDYANSKVSDCINEAVVSANGTVGGIVGDAKECPIDKCLNKGNITGSNKDEVGGIAGACWFKDITDCKNEGNIVGNSQQVGGIVGYGHKHKISNCTNMGNVTGKGNFVAGIAAFTNSTASNVISNCVNEGAIKATEGNYAGGIAGAASGGVISCQNKGNVQGVCYVAGIIGNLEGGDNENSRKKVYQCRNTANVSGGAGNDTRIGGIIGCAVDYCTIEECSNPDTGKKVTSEGKRVGGVAGYLHDHAVVTNCYNRSTVYGQEDVGGIVGYMWSGSTLQYSYCKTVDKIDGHYGVDGKASSYSNIGGILGRIRNEDMNSVTLFRNYWEYDCAKKGIGYKSNGASGSNSDKPKYDYYQIDDRWIDSKKFEEWNFSKVWEIANGATAPSLKFEASFQSNPDPNLNPTPIHVDEPEEINDKQEHIKNIDELKAFRDKVNAGDDYKGAIVYLEADIDLEDEIWTPIGSALNPFKGEFDGQGHSITGLNVNCNDNTYNSAGFFGTVKGDAQNKAVIRNLAVYGSVINSNNDVIAYAGGIVGYIHYGIVEQCMFFGDLGTDLINSVSVIGGIAGDCRSSRIENCISLGGSISSSYIAGGIAGCYPDSQIVRCYNDSDVISSEYNNYNIDYANGIGGLSREATNDTSGIILNCFYRQGCDEYESNDGSLNATDRGEIASYTSFDFTDVWGHNQNHPVLMQFSSMITLNSNWSDSQNNDTAFYYIDKKTGAIPIHSFKSNDYYFVGWNTKTDGSGLTYEENDHIGTDATLYAQWQKGSRYDYIVGYDTVDSVMFDKKITSGKKSDSGTCVSFCTKEYVKASGIIFASNREFVQTVSFTLEALDDNTGKWIVLKKVDNGVYVTTGGNEKLWKIDGNDKEYYRFRLTFDSSIDVSEIYLILPELTDNYKRQAKVTLNPNGGKKGNYVDPVILRGDNYSDINLTANEFTRDGFSFAGWNTESDGSGITYTDTAAYPVKGDSDLYAIWSEQAYTVTFLDEDGNELYKIDLPGGSMPLYKGDKELENYVKDGKEYGFSGWNPSITAVTGPATYRAVYREVKSDTQVTSPTAVNNLIYNGSKQKLISEGTVIGGKMQYAIQNEDGSIGIYTADIPEETDAKEYVVYFKAIGDRLHYDSSVESVKVIILPKEIAVPSVELNSGEIIFDGNVKEPLVIVKDGTTVIPESEYTVEYSDNINAGTAVVTVRDKIGGNYTVSGASITFSINKANRNMTAVTGVDETIQGKNDGRLVGLSNEMEISAVSETAGFSAVADISGNGYAPGTYYIRYAENGNYKVSDTITVIVSAGRKLKAAFYDGDAEYSVSELSYNEMIVKPADPQKNGFTFNGWYADKALTTQFDFTAGIIADVEIYAGWIEEAPTNSPSPSPSEVPTDTPSPSRSEASTDTPSPSPSETPTDTPSPSPSEAPTDTPSPSLTEAPTDTPSPSPTEAPTDTPSPSLTEAPTDTPSPSLTETPTNTPSPTETPSPEVTPSPVVAPTSTPEPSYDNENVVSKKTYPYSEVTKKNNKDGSITTTTITYYEDGSVHKLVVKEWKNGNKNTGETLTNGQNVLEYRMSEKIRYSKTGDVIVRTNIWKIGGYSYSSYDKTLESGEGRFKAKVTTEDQSIISINESRKADGSISRRLKESDINGGVKLTYTTKDAKDHKTVSTYTVIGEKQAKLVEFTTDLTEITIPSTIKFGKERFSVVAVAKKAFKKNKTVTRLTLGKSITTLGKKAMVGLESLEEVTIRSTKKIKVYAGAFAGVKGKTTFMLRAKGNIYTQNVNEILNSGVNKGVTFEKIK